MFKLSVVILITLITISMNVMAKPSEFRIFDLKRTLPLNDKEKIYSDYYMSLGSEQGLQPGDIVSVYRRVPVMDNYSAINHDDMQVAVGQLKIIYTQKTMSIGRLIKQARPANMPVLEFEKVMVGDRVEIASQAKRDVASEH